MESDNVYAELVSQPYDSMAMESTRVSEDTRSATTQMARTIRATLRRHSHSPTSTDTRQSLSAP
jgi:hypothetical protein